MTLQRFRTAVAQTGGAGEWLVFGIGFVGLPALLVTIAPSTTNVGVGLAALVGLFAGDVAWSWVTSKPMFWHRPTKEEHPLRSAALVLLGLIVGSLVMAVTDQILPMTTVVSVGPNGGEFTRDLPANVVVWLAVLWLVLLILQVLWAAAKRVFRALRPDPSLHAA